MQDREAKKLPKYIKSKFNMMAGRYAAQWKPITGLSGIFPHFSKCIVSGSIPSIKFV